MLKPGDIFGGTNETNPSYFAPAYYRVFAQVTNTPRWMDVLNKSYEVLEACANDQTGLVPDWCTASGGATRGSGTATTPRARRFVSPRTRAGTTSRAQSRT